MSICCDPYHVDNALALWQDIFLKVTSANVSHNRKLQRAVILAHDSSDILLITELPLTEPLDVKKLLRSLVAELHVFNA